MTGVNRKTENNELEKYLFDQAIINSLKQVYVCKYVNAIGLTQGERQYINLLTDSRNVLFHGRMR